MSRCWMTLFALALLAESAAGIVTSDAFGSHVVTPGVPAFGLNLDGVGIVGGAPPFGPPIGVCSCALVSDVHVLTAAHCFDENSDGQLVSPMAPFPDSIVFELASGQVAIEYDFQSVQLPQSWPQVNADLAIVTLNAPAPAGIPRYTLYGGTKEVGQRIVLVGYGDPGHGATGAVTGGDPQPTKRAGLNRYDAIRDDMPGVEFLAYDFDSGLAEQNALAIFGYESDLGFAVDEVDTAPGDSGGPAFLGGAIAGVTAFGARLPGADFNEVLDSSWGEGGFDARVSQFQDFLRAATAGQALFVVDGDYNHNGSVDAADYVLWRTTDGTREGYDAWRAHFGQTPGSGGNGGVTGNDFTIWRDNYSAGTSAGAAATIPEPSTAEQFSLVLLSSFFVARNGRATSIN